MGGLQASSQFRSIQLHMGLIFWDKEKAWPSRPRGCLKAAPLCITSLKNPTLASWLSPNSSLGSSGPLPPAQPQGAVPPLDQWIWPPPTPNGLPALRVHIEARSFATKVCL